MSRLEKPVDESTNDDKLRRQKTDEAKTSSKKRLGTRTWVDTTEMASRVKSKDEGTG
jgi:hypothetical protein